MTLKGRWELRGAFGPVDDAEVETILREIRGLPAFAAAFGDVDAHLIELVHIAESRAPREAVSPAWERGG